MPKRVLDGEGLWRSDKLSRVEPIAARAEYANILPLALANGSFECSAQRVWSLVYSFNRPDISIDDLETFLQAFEDAKLLFRWTEPDGKSWGYFVGIEKPGRLPGKSRKGRNEKVGPDPPAEGLRKFLDSKTFPGFGSGSGLGSGPGIGARSRASHALRSPALSAPSVCEQIVAAWNANRGTLPEVKKLTETRRRKISSRFQSDPEFLKTFTGAVEKATHTPFLCGGGKSGWRATFDWMIESDTNAVAVMEGKYDNSTGGLTHGEKRTLNNLKAASLVH